MTLSTDELKAAVNDVLERALADKTGRPQFMTAYKILQRVPEVVREALVAQYAEPGRGAGKPFSAASRIGQIADQVGEQGELDARGLTFDAQDVPNVSGYPSIKLYRARRP